MNPRHFPLCIGMVRVAVFVLVCVTVLAMAVWAEEPSKCTLPQKPLKHLTPAPDKIVEAGTPSRPSQHQTTYRFGYKEVGGEPVEPKEKKTVPEEKKEAPEEKKEAPEEKKEAPEEKKEAPEEKKEAPEEKKTEQEEKKVQQEEKKEEKKIEQEEKKVKEEETQEEKEEEEVKNELKTEAEPPTPEAAKEQTADDTEAAVRALFDHFDTDKSNHLSIDELAQMMEDLSDEEISDEELALALSYVDKDASGEVSWDEFWKFYQEQATVTSEEEEKQAVSALFAFYDKDSSGELTADEVHTMANELSGRDVSQEEVDEMVKATDADGSGSVSFNEMWAWWQSVDTEEVEEEEGERTAPTDKAEVVPRELHDEGQAVLHSSAALRHLGEAVEKVHKK